MSIKDFFQKH